MSLVGRSDLECLLTVDRDPTGTWTNRVGLLPAARLQEAIDRALPAAGGA